MYNFLKFSSSGPVGTDLVDLQQVSKHCGPGVQNGPATSGFEFKNEIHSKFFSPIPFGLDD